MGPKERDRKARAERLAKIIQGLSEPSSTRVERARNVAAALELPKLAGLLESTEQALSVVQAVIRPGTKFYTTAEAAELAGMSLEEFHRLNLAAGFADPGPEAKVFSDEDIEAFQIFKTATGVFGEQPTIQMVRAIGSSMARVADAFLSAFAQAVGAESQEREFSEEEFLEANERAAALIPMGVRAMDVVLRRHLAYRSRPEMAMGDEWTGVDTVERAVGFCDLVGYTALSQQISSLELATVLGTFETIAADLVTSRGGNVVKLIGDEVMFVAPDARTAADIGIELTRAFRDRTDVPPVRVGIACGQVVTREGDYFGPVVNLAARLVKLAPPSIVLAPATMRDDVPDGPFEDVGAELLKGFDEPVDIVRVGS